MALLPGLWMVSVTIARAYPLEVVAKWHGTHGFGSVTLRPPAIDGGAIDTSRPYWVDRTHTGSPLTLDLTPDEMDAVTVGDLFMVTLNRAAP